jgi:hypothetical protein
MRYGEDVNIHLRELWVEASVLRPKPPLESEEDPSSTMQDSWKPRALSVIISLVFDAVVAATFLRCLGSHTMNRPLRMIVS